MATDELPYQLPLAQLAPRAGKQEHALLLGALDAYGLVEIEARAAVDITQRGGRFARPRAYLCSDGQIYWTKTRSQTGLCSELILNRLAFRLHVGPATSIVRLDGFLTTRGNSIRGVGTTNINHVISSKEISGPSELPVVVDPTTWAKTAVFQSWVDIVDQQVLIGTKDGRIYSFDHGDAFRQLLSGPPRMVMAEIAGARLDWSTAATAALSMVDEIEALTPVEVLEAAAGIPDEPGWNSMFPRRLAISRWLLKRQALLRREVIKWTRTVA